MTDLERNFVLAVATPMDMEVTNACFNLSGPLSLFPLNRISSPGEVHSDEFLLAPSKEGLDSELRLPQY